jgi:hypothetical protein
MIIAVLLIGLVSRLFAGTYAVGSLPYRSGIVNNSGYQRVVEADTVEQLAPEISGNWAEFLQEWMKTGEVGSMFIINVTNKENNPYQLIFVKLEA